MTRNALTKHLTRIGTSTSPAKSKAARENGKLGGRPAKYKCRSCGATGRDISRWKYKGKGALKAVRTKFKCRLCGSTRIKVRA